MPVNRETYHHGDLKRALLAAGLAHAREGGPDAVSLREVARENGVTVPAVYRHFADRGAFLAELAMRAQAELAQRITAAAGDRRGRELLRACGTEYIRFALDEPGLFATAFGVPHDLANSLHPDAAGAGERTPFGFLGSSLDEMVADGELRPAARPGAEVACWAMVHGYAALVSGGPLRFLPAEQVDALASLCVDAVILGVAAR